MKKMAIGIVCRYTEQYRPSKRHKTPREREMITVVDISVKQPTEEEFPVAMIVSDYASVYEGARSYREIMERKDSKYQIISDEIRFYQGRFYKARRISHGAAVSTEFAPIEEAVEDIRYIGKNNKYIPETDSPFVDGTSIVLGNDLAERSAEIRDEADSYLFFQDKIWEECGEPRYEIVTFGLGHNHGGTAMFIKYEYNHNIAAKTTSTLCRDPRRSLTSTK